MANGYRAFSVTSADPFFVDFEAVIIIDIYQIFLNAIAHVPMYAQCETMMIEQNWWSDNVVQPWSW